MANLSNLNNAQAQDIRGLAWALAEAWAALTNAKREDGGWDTLDALLERTIRDDKHAKYIVNALMEIETVKEQDAAEEVAIRIIGNRELRF